MSFAVTGLPLETFRPLFGLDDEALAARGVIRRTATPGGRYPCRITLEDAAPGDTLLLMNYQDHACATPYRNAYAIYVNETAAETRRTVDEVPGVLRGRPIALRVFDAAGMLIAAQLVLDDTVRQATQRQFANPEAAYIHAHNAAAGCFAARIDRA
jgi:hypothetical protein